YPSTGKKCTTQSTASPKLSLPLRRWSSSPPKPQVGKSDRVAGLSLFPAVSVFLAAEKGVFTWSGQVTSAAAISADRFVVHNGFRNGNQVSSRLIPYFFILLVKVSRTMPSIRA